MSENTARYRFEVVRKIGAGSLFTVYRARDMLLNTTVALKVLRKEYAESAEFAAALKESVRQALKIIHPHVTRVFSVGQESKHVFVAEELVEGGTLHDLLVNEAPLSQWRALDLFLQVCTGVAEGHRRHCPHGDLRPHNILLDEQERPKVTDFGVAAAFAATDILQTEVTVRTLHYLAPERARGGRVSVAADIYSLGIILFQMLTGSVPFDAVSAATLARKHAEQSPPPMHALNPRVSQGLESVVRRCLAKAPRERFPSVDALITQLKTLQGSSQFADEPSEPELRQGRRTRRTWLAFASIVSSLLVFTLCVGAVYAPYWWWRYTAPKEVEVPDVVGRSRLEAEQTLNRLKLGLRVAREEYSSDVPQGHVVRTEPAAGMKVKEGRLVSVVLSRGADMVTVPDVTKTSLERAKGILTKIGLIPDEVREVYNGAVPEGYVCGQSPRALTRAMKGTHVALQISRGPRQEESRNAASPGAPRRPHGPKKMARVTMRVPQGPARQKVRFVISDDSGDHVVYDKEHAPGDRIVKTVSGHGEVVRLQIFLDDELLREQELQ